MHVGEKIFIFFTADILGELNNIKYNFCNITKIHEQKLLAMMLL